MIAELGRRLQRIELLLFSMPEQQFHALDKHIADILNDSTNSKARKPNYDDDDGSNDLCAESFDICSTPDITDCSQDSVCELDHGVKENASVPADVMDLLRNTAAAESSNGEVVLITTPSHQTIVFLANPC